MNILISKFKEVMFSVMPIFFIVILLNFTIIPIENIFLIRFIIGVFFITIGLTVFLFGVDIGITPLGKMIGKHLAKTNNILIIIIAGLIIGFLISSAEPSLNIVAEQISQVSGESITQKQLVVVVSIGLAVTLTLGLIRLLYNFSITLILLFLYGIVIILSFLTPREFLVIAFDSSGATTGAMAVPFIVSFSIGISALKKNSFESEDNSFGLIAITSVGPILAVMIMSILIENSNIKGDILNEVVKSEEIIRPFLNKIAEVIKNVTYSILPIFFTFLFFQKFSFKLKLKAFFKIIKGMTYTSIGLIFLFLGVNAGFMEVGNIIGYSIASKFSPAFVVFSGFVIGFVTVLAEPAVHFLTRQIEDVTSGAIKKNLIMIFLSFGIGIAIALSVVRILSPWLEFRYFVFSGYIIAILLSFKVPKLFVGIAFDAGGVASGPMTATFILAYIQGISKATEGADVVVDGFGMISMVALIPVIALQILGLIYKKRSSD